MSQPHRRDSPRSVRPLPKLPRIDEATAVDVQAAPTAVSKNVIPFTKPRAIAELAATDPNAIVTMAPASAAPDASHSRISSHAPRASEPRGAPTSAPGARHEPVPTRSARFEPRGTATSAAWSEPFEASAPSRVDEWVRPSAPRARTAFQASATGHAAAPTRPAVEGHTGNDRARHAAVGARASMSAAPVSAPTDRLSTGWTPPRAVKTVAQPPPMRAPLGPSVAPPLVTPPVTSSTIASPPNASVALPAPVIAPLPPVPPPACLPAQPQAPVQPWAQYEALGLGAPRPPSQRAAKLIVTAYRLLGFGILTVIVFVLIGYIATTAFFYVSDSWVVPMAVSPTDEKVVAQQAQLAEQQHARDRLADELNQAERAIAAQQTFQAEFARAIRSDLEGRKLALGRLRELAGAAAATRTAIKHQSSAYAQASRRRMAAEYAAGLIDRDRMLSGKFQLAQITSSNLSLAERQAELDTRAADLETEARSLEAILGHAETSGDVALSYEVLRIKRELESSKLDLARSVESRDTLKAALERQDRLLAALRQSAQLRALRDGATVAFVPYGNLSNATKGTSLYACKVAMVFCYHVGEVLEVLPGEVQFKHPHRDKQLRGQLVELKLDADDADAASEDVLFAGGRPLLF